MNFAKQAENAAYILLISALVCAVLLYYGLGAFCIGAFLWMLGGLFMVIFEQ